MNRWRHLLTIFWCGCSSNRFPPPLLERSLEGGWSLRQSPLSNSISLCQIDLLSQTADAADVSRIRPALAQAVRTLRGAGVALSDRRIVKAQKLCAAAAALAGRVQPSEADLWPLVYAVPTGEQQALARECLRDLLAASENATLPVAAEDASQGPMARATRLARAAQEILQARPGPHDEAGQKAWRLRLEGLAREIDAGFAPEELPQILMDVRVALISYLSTKL